GERPDSQCKRPALGGSSACSSRGDYLIARSCSFLPDSSAATTHSGLRPRPVQVSRELAGLRYFGATFPRVFLRPAFLRAAPLARRLRVPPPVSSRISATSSPSSLARATNFFASSFFLDFLRESICALHALIRSSSSETVSFVMSGSAT